MKGFAILIFAVVGFVYASSVLTPPPTCPKPDPEGGVVIFPNPDDCSTFYMCSGLIPVIMDCLNGTWFNPEAGVCDWPVNIPEGVCLAPTEAPPPVETPAPTEAPPPTEAPVETTVGPEIY